MNLLFWLFALALVCVAAALGLRFVAGRRARSSRTAARAQGRAASATPALPAQPAASALTDSVQMLRINEAERTRVGQELHDGLGQQLTGVAFLAKALERKLIDRGLAEAADATWIVRLVNEAISRTRAIARGLHAVGLEQNGLSAALRQLCNDVATLYGVKCSFRCDETSLALDNTVANHLYRIAQEAVNNALKHGFPHAIVVAMSERAGRVRLAIRDDGVGFDAARARVHSVSMGLTGMRHRCGLIHAQLVVRSWPDKGTLVLVRLDTRDQYRYKYHVKHDIKHYTDISTESATSRGHA